MTWWLVSYSSLWKVIYLDEDRQSEYVWYCKADKKNKAMSLFVIEHGTDNFICDVFIADEDEVEAYEQGFIEGGDWEYQKAYESGKAVLIKRMLDTMYETKVPWKRKVIKRLIEKVCYEGD
jgi:hypothetical protein